MILQTSWSLISNDAPTPIDTKLLRSDEQYHYRHIANDFESAKKFLSMYNVHNQGPLFILLMSDKMSDGQYWCPDCEQAKTALFDVLQTTSTRHLIVHIGTMEQWFNDSNYFRTHPLFHINEIPALLQYVGKLHTKPLLTGAAHLSDPIILHEIFTAAKSSTQMPSLLHMSTVNEMESYIETYREAKQTHLLFVYFVSGRTASGELWCPYCASAELPVTTYFKYLAPKDAVMLRVVTADSVAAWHSPKNPFKVQKLVAITGLPMLIRAKPTGKVLEYEEFTDYFEETAQLRAFYQGAPFTSP